MCIRDRAENYKALMDAIMKAKPSALKGQYLKSITLATTMGPGAVSYTHLDVYKRQGIDGMAYGTVIKMCNKLNLNPVDFSSLERDTTISEQLLENRVMQAYVKLNQEGRDKVMDLMEDFGQIKKYKAK